MKLTNILYVLLPLMLFTGCAGTNTSDPYEGYNRKVDAFNEGVDKAILKPVAIGYKKVTPELVQQAVGNASKNLATPRYMVNDLLQGNPKKLLEHTQRFLINSTFGVAGIFDLTDTMRLPAHSSNDMGMTLARYGWKDSNYFILPLLGPATVRDATGRVLDLATNPRDYVINIYANSALFMVQAVHLRSGFLTAQDIAKQAALDPYVFQREAYRQFRQNQLHKLGYVNSATVKSAYDNEDDELSILDIARNRNR